MRNPNRIDEFMQRLHYIWKNECPDWRFGQFICNVFNQLDFDPFMLEDEQMLYEIERFFNLVDTSKDPIAVHKELLYANFNNIKKGDNIYDGKGKLITRTYKQRSKKRSRRERK